MYCYYAPDERSERGEAGMVLVVIYPLCAHVSVHLKKAYLAYFVVYIPHFRLLVIGDIYAKICAKIWLARMWFISQVKRFDCDAFHKLGFRETACDVFHKVGWQCVKDFTISDMTCFVIVFTISSFPWAVCGVCEGGVWCRVVRGVCCWGYGVCEGRYPSDASEPEKY